MVKLNFAIKIFFIVFLILTLDIKHAVARVFEEKAMAVLENTHAEPECLKITGSQFNAHIPERTGVMNPYLHLFLNLSEMNEARTHAPLPAVYIKNQCTDGIIFQKIRLGESVETLAETKTRSLWIGNQSDYRRQQFKFFTLTADGFECIASERTFEDWITPEGDERHCNTLYLDSQESILIPVAIKNNYSFTGVVGSKPDKSDISTFTITGKVADFVVPKNKR